MTASALGHAALGLLRNRATPVKHKFISFVIERDPSGVDTALGVARLALLAAGAAAQAVEIGLLVAAAVKSDALQAEAAARDEQALWKVTYKVASRWFEDGNLTDDPSGQRPVEQEKGGAGARKLTVSKVAVADLAEWQPSGVAVQEYVKAYDGPGTTEEVEEEAYDLGTLSDWTAWGAVAKPERLAIEALVGAARDFHDARTAVRYTGGKLETQTAVLTLEGAALEDATVDLPLDRDWLEEKLVAQTLLISLPVGPERAGLYSMVERRSGTPVAADDGRSCRFEWTDSAAKTGPKVFLSTVGVIDTYAEASLHGEHPATYKILDGLDGSKAVSALTKVAHISATERKSALKSLTFTDSAGANGVSPTGASKVVYFGGVLALLDGAAPAAATRYPLAATGRVETTYQITVSSEITAVANAGDRPNDWAMFGTGVLLNTEFMRWFAEFQEIDYQGNLANADGFYELGTNGPRPMFRTFDWHGVSLKTGFVNQRWLWNWTQSVDWGNDFRKDLAIIMFDRGGLPLRLIRVMNAFPVSWKGPPLSAGDSGSQPIESIDLTCESLEVFSFPI